MAGAPTLLLRTDGGPEIGGGHVMRCLALAQAWQDEGGRALIAAATLAPALRRRILAEGIECREVPGPRGSADDRRATLAAARDAGAAAIVVDGYRFDPAYRRGLRDTGLKVAALDDNDEIGALVDDIVVNQNHHATAALYPERARHTRLLLGTGYALLRREFLAWQGPPRRFPPVAQRILVTLGAADPGNVTGTVIAALAPALPAGTAVTIVVGGSNPHEAALAAQAGDLGFHLLRDPQEPMPALMAGADLAVSAGGSTMWELAFMGLPFIGAIIADNQRQAAAAMDLEGYSMLEAGALAEALPAVLSRLLPDRGRRTLLSRQGRRLVDGQGGARVCRALRALTGG